MDRKRVDAGAGRSVPVAASGLESQGSGADPAAAPMTHGGV